jgi:hypothetical protein
MELSELEKLISDRNVLITLNSMVLDIRRLPPNGATIHRRNNYSSSLESYGCLIKDMSRHDPIFLELKNSDLDMYSDLVRLMLKTVNEFGILI